ncbi:hypothetical protein CKX30_04990, partial [Brucella abortus]
QNNPSPKKAVTLSGDQSSGGDSAGSTLTPSQKCETVLARKCSSFPEHPTSRDCAKPVPA